MRAHFAGDVVSPTGNCASIIGESNVVDMGQSQPAIEQQLQTRITEFKQDSKNMEAVNVFIDEVLQKAEAEAVKQQQARECKNITEPKEKLRQSFAIPDFKNGKVVNRARGLVVRLFDAICNCANTAAAAAPGQRIKLRGKRAASTANGSGGGPTGSDAANTAEMELNEKNAKKYENGKEKKENEKKKKKEDAAEEQLLLQQQQQKTVSSVTK